MNGPCPLYNVKKSLDYYCKKHDSLSLHESSMLKLKQKIGLHHKVGVVVGRGPVNVPSESS